MLMNLSALRSLALPTGCLRLLPSLLLVASMQLAPEVRGTALAQAASTSQPAPPASPAPAPAAIPQATAPSQAPAAANDVTVDSINKKMRTRVETIKDRLDSFQAQVKQDRQDDAELADIKVKAEEIISDMQAASQSMKDRIDQIDGRLKALGQAPAAGQPAEPPAVSEERLRLNNERSQLNLIADDATNLGNSATQLANTISTIRRNLFAQTLFRHTAMDGTLFSDAGTAFVTETQNFGSTFGSWVSFVARFKPGQLVGAIALSLLAAMIIFRGGHHLFRPMLVRFQQEEPSYIRRLSVAFWSTVLQTLSTAAFLILSYLFLDGFNVLRPDMAPIIANLFGFIWFVSFVWKLTSRALAPREPDWRLVRVTNSSARLLRLAAIVMAVVNGLDYLLGTISEVLNSPLVVTIAKSLLASIIIGAILIAMSFMRPLVSKQGEFEMPGRPWPRVITVILRVAGGLLILAAGTGYIGLARFVATQVVLTGAVAAIMYIGLLSGKAISKQGAFKDTFIGRRLAERRQLGEVALDQAGLVAGLIIYVIALLFGVPLILLTWGFKNADIESWIVGFFTEIRIGSVSISIVSIFGGMLLFAAGYVVTRWIQKWVDNNVMARSHVDLGVRNSVKTGIGYLGVGLAVLVGVSAAGINLSSFALVASALSVGIGFGLQNIVSNFVSGLILLVERPFKVGDQVITGTTEGIVKRISVRATEIETFRKQTIIVPNSELINAPVGNWTHKNRIQRSEIPVGVSYDADPEKVIGILLELVDEIPEVLRNPEPHVEFLRFGPSSLDFELRFHLADMGDGLRIRNALRIAILKRFREEGISIPLPQQEIVFHRADFLAAEETEDGRGGA